MDVLRPAHPPLDQFGYLPRVTTRDGREIEQAMAGATLLDAGARLDGAVIEASYAITRPPLLKRLRDDRVRRVIDPQTLRFVGDRYRETATLSALPYAPDRPITVNGFSEAQARALAFGSMSYAQDRGTDTFMAPALPLRDADRTRWEDHNVRLLNAACAVNGSTDIDRLPMLAQLAPGAQAMANPDRVLQRLQDFPIDGVYIQALNLDPVRDSLEKLARFVQFLGAVRDLGFPVIVGRVGAFGLVLQALGFPLFDSGLGQAETHDLASLNRAITEKERERRASGKGGGATRRLYLEPLKTTLDAKQTTPLLADATLRSHLACNLGCCRFRTIETLPERGRQHFLYVRRREVDRMRSLNIPAMRLHQMESDLQTARSLAHTLRAAFPDAGLPDFGHIDRWLGLLSREQQLALAA